jgi:predicted deacetylase
VFETDPSPDRRLLVALHDVTPVHEPRIAKAFALLEEFGVSEVALFVVPRWHGTADLPDHPDFVARLRARQEAGAEVFLHGLRHDEAESERTPMQHLRAFGRTDREAEFLSLTPAEADRRIGEGLAMFEELGLDPVGFVPPAWFHGAGLDTVLHGRGFSVSEDAWSVIRVADGQRIRAPAVQWSARARYRAIASVTIAAIRLPLEQPRSLLRLAIHPPDLEVPMVTDSLRRALEYLLARRTTTTYRAVIEAA